MNDNEFVLAKEVIALHREMPVTKLKYLVYQCLRDNYINRPVSRLLVDRYSEIAILTFDIFPERFTNPRFQKEHCAKRFCVFLLNKIAGLTIKDIHSHLGLASTTIGSILKETQEEFQDLAIYFNDYNELIKR